MAPLIRRNSRRVSLVSPSNGCNGSLFYDWLLVVCLLSSGVIRASGDTGLVNPSSALVHVVGFGIKSSVSALEPTVPRKRLETYIKYWKFYSTLEHEENCSWKNKLVGPGASHPSRPRNLHGLLIKFQELKINPKFQLFASPFRIYIFLLVLKFIIHSGELLERHIGTLSIEKISDSFISLINFLI